MRHTTERVIRQYTVKPTAGLPSAGRLVSEEGWLACLHALRLKLRACHPVRRTHVSGNPILCGAGYRFPDSSPTGALLCSSPGHPDSNDTIAETSARMSKLLVTSVGGTNAGRQPPSRREG